MKKYFYIFLLISTALLYGCGVKGYPKPPRSYIPEKVHDLKVKQQGRFFLIYWKYKKVYIDGIPFDKEPEFLLITDEIKEPVYPHKYKNIYWIYKKIENFNQKECFKIQVKLNGKKSKPSNSACITPTDKYPIQKQKLTVQIKENGLLLKWNILFPTVNIYRGKSEDLILPIPYKTVKNSLSFLDTDVKLNKPYCYYVTNVLSQNIEGEKSDTVCIIYKDIIPPKPPENGDIVLEDGKAIILWDESPSKDVIGYKIYKNGKELINTLIKAYFFIDKTYKKGDRYIIIAVDKAGNKSKPLFIK